VRSWPSPSSTYRYELTLGKFQATTDLWCFLGTLLNEFEDFFCALFDGVDTNFLRRDTSLDLFQRSPLIKPRHFKVEPRIDRVIHAVRTEPEKGLVGEQLSLQSLEILPVAHDQSVKLPLPSKNIL
jgi:hypothetical protein